MLPREGIHLGFLLSTFETWALKWPTITLYAILTIMRIYSAASDPDNWRSGTTYWLLFASLAAAIARKIHIHASRSSINNGMLSEQVNLDEELIVVTGGSSGIGESLVQLIRSKSAKAKIVVIDIVPPKATLLKTIHFYHCDLSDHIKVEETAAQIKTDVGTPTVLVNNAGLSRGRYMSELEWADVNATLSVNLMAPFLLIGAFLPAMISSNRGHIVNISSMSAFVPPAGLADYGATKAGLLAMTESLRLELRHKHQARRVRVSAFVLSFVQTPLFKGKTNQSEFISPLLHVDTCGEAILEAIESGSSVVRFMPGIGGLLGGIWSFPRWLQDAVLDSTMKLSVDFKGRQQIGADGGVVP